MAGGARKSWGGRSTQSVHGGEGEHDVGAPVVQPIHQTSTFFSDPDGVGEVLYTRFGNNPTQRLLEARIAALEGAEACVVTGSGMAAMASALLSHLGAGARVIAADALYGGTRALLDREFPRLGIETEYVDFGADGWADALARGADAVLVEVPTNPLLRVPDVPAIAEAARAVDSMLIIDATFATPINLRPLEHGADLVVHSATKYLGGHSDVTAGAVVGSALRIAAVRDRVRNFGPSLDPHAAWLVERGIKTLAVRMERHNRNGRTVADWCSSDGRIARVHYPGLSAHPDHAVALRLLDGFGGMVSLELVGGGDAAASLMRRLRLAKVAPSLGGVETLVSEPRYTSHAALPPEKRVRDGIPDGFVRFSLGIEDAEDIIEDLDHALGRR